MVDPAVLRMGHRRLASVVARDGDRDDEACDVRLTWRDTTSVAIELRAAIAGGGAADGERVVASLAAALRRAHADGAEYAMAHVGPDDRAAVHALLRVGFEPELAGPGDEAAWNRLLEHESRLSGLL
ncbi:MAG TPA: hypothetical protein VGO03_07970 [Acidimicrobiia bacterium]